MPSGSMKPQKSTSHPISSLFVSENLARWLLSSQTRGGAS
jgi:hypothetical protein